MDLFHCIHVYTTHLSITLFRVIIIKYCCFVTYNICTILEPNSDPCKTDNPHAYLYSCQEEENPSLCRPCDFYCNGTQIKDCHAENARCVCENGFRVNDNGICVEQCPGDLTTPKTTQSTPTRTPSLPPTTTPAPGIYLSIFEYLN